MDGEGAEEAGMGQAVMAKGQQNHLDADRPKTGRPGLCADEERLRFVSDAMKNGIELSPIGFAPKLKEGKTSQLLEEDRIGS
jgi:hypothetical protein